MVFHSSKAESGKLRLLTSELSYLSNLQKLLKAQPNSEVESSASVFVSAGSINNALAGANGTSVTLPSPGFVLKITGIEAQFSDGFPKIIAHIETSRHSPEIFLKAELTGVLEPRLDKMDPSKLLFYLRPRYVRLEGENVSKDQQDMANYLLTYLTQSYTDKLPHIDLSLSKDFAIAFPATKIPLLVPTQAGRLDGELDIPGLSFRSSLSLSGLIKESRTEEH